MNNSKVSCCTMKKSQCSHSTAAPSLDAGLSWSIKKAILQLSKYKNCKTASQSKVFLKLDEVS